MRAGGLHADAAHLLGAGVGADTEQLVQPLDQRRDVRAEQAARIKVGQQMLHGQQGVDLFGCEPEPRQFVLRADGRGLPVKPPASPFAVEYNRCVHAVAQVRDVALDGGRRGAEFFNQELPRQAAAGIEKTLQPVQPLGL